ncbi:MAG: FtsW/RodA/SpoVE family cell cycle protein [Chitinispirillaceae bacterium]
MTAKFGRMDTGLFIALLVLLGIGIVLVYSSSFAVAQKDFGGADFFLARQIVRALVAVVLFMIVINVDYHLWSKYSGVIFIAAVCLLAYVLFLPESHALKGAKRWITLGSVRFQVSDLGRMALVLMLAKKCGGKQCDTMEWRALMPHLARVGLISALVVLEPDFSTAFIIAVTGFAILFMAGVKVKHLAAVILAMAPLAVGLILKTPYRMMRILGYFNFSENRDNLGYQVFQSLVGLGNGGLFGTGLGKGEQKYFYLPEPHTDFILSVLGEEFGFLGIVLVFGIFAFVIYRGMKIALNAPDKAGQLMAFGFTFIVAVYALVHSAVATGLVPPTGIPMPFLSYGGMSLIFTMCSMGILLNISSQSRISTLVSVADKRVRKARNVKI